MIYLLLTAVAYFYFNWSYFDHVKKLSLAPRRRVGLIFISFAVNYLFFFVCSVLEFPLVLNWSLFSVLLFLETLIYNGNNKRFALFNTLMGILYGLAMNIFCRSIVAIIANQPLQSFDNHVSSGDNLKGLPVCLGFLLTGVVLQLMGLPVLVNRLRLILNHPKQHSFLLEIMGGLFFYLFLNLLLYSTPLNDLLLKLWSIKSCLFCVVGFYIAVRYTWRVCELGDYRDKNRQMEQELNERRQEEEHLRRQASLDVLTGLYNREAGEETVSSLMERKADFSLCFLDLDGLKSVNDRYGHDEGDRYILTATEYLRRACRNNEDQLFRYGGDEFLILFMGVPAGAAAQKTAAVNERLRSLKNNQNFPYSLSVSYGVVESAGFSDWRILISSADSAMYEQKRQKQAARE